MLKSRQSLAGAPGGLCEVTLILHAQFTLFTWKQFGFLTNLVGVEVPAVWQFSIDKQNFFRAPRLTCLTRDRAKLGAGVDTFVSSLQGYKRKPIPYYNVRRCPLIRKVT